MHEQPVVIVDLDGRQAFWSPQEGFTGDPDIVAAAHLAVDIDMSVDVGEHIVRAGENTAAGAVGALSAHMPGRTIVLKMPEGCLESGE